ncbi:MAG TPA: hypothetical protein VKV73_09385, partial [Chloroflexota bacterium]|nr:hypothetical protein [Chloroflexota bacterium]
AAIQHPGVRSLWEVMRKTQPLHEDFRLATSVDLRRAVTGDFHLALDIPGATAAPATAVPTSALATGLNDPLSGGTLGVNYVGWGFNLPSAGYVDGAGQMWAKAHLYDGTAGWSVGQAGSSDFTTLQRPLTADASLYSHMWRNASGPVTFQAHVSAGGTYTVILKMADMECRWPGCRVVSATVNSVAVPGLQGWDVFGGSRRSVHDFPITGVVPDGGGLINVVVTSTKGGSQLNAVLVTRTS